MKERGAKEQSGRTRPGSGHAQWRTGALSHRLLESTMFSLSVRPLSLGAVTLVYPRKLDDIGQGCSSSIAMMIFHGHR